MHAPSSRPAEASDSSRPNRTEQLVGVGILLLLVLIVTACAVQVLTNRDYFLRPAESVYAAAAVRPFPEIASVGWAAPAETGRFDADEMYLKIDGRADGYIARGVVGLTFGTYRHESDPGRQIDVYRYELKSPDQARALYESERPPGVSEEPVGRAGYQTGGAVFFSAGSEYVQVLPAGRDDRDAKAAREVATALADEIEEAGRRHGE
jgi:hypothetical protein